MALSPSQLRNSQRYRKKKIEEGYCNRCRCRKATSGLKSCRHCREILRKASKKQRVKYKRRMLLLKIQ